MHVYANKCMQVNECTVALCVHFVLASAFAFLAAGPKESNRRVNFKL